MNLRPSEANIAYRAVVGAARSTYRLFGASCFQKHNVRSCKRFVEKIGSAPCVRMDGYVIDDTKRHSKSYQKVQL